MRRQPAADAAWPHTYCSGASLPGTCRRDLDEPDAADALGVAIKHAHAGQVLARLADAGVVRRTSGAYRAGRGR